MLNYCVIFKIVSEWIFFTVSCREPRQVKWFRDYVIHGRGTRHGPTTRPPYPDRNSENRFRI